MNRAIATGCLFLSGAAGLVHEVCWIQRASLAFGSTTYALSTILAIFFLGLAAGSWSFGRVSLRVERPLVLFAWLELGVGVLALASLPLLAAVESLFGHVFRAAPDAPGLHALARVGLLALVLAPPAALMGGTLPLVCRGLATARSRVAGTVGVLYAANTLGAAAGCALCGFVLLPALGLRWSLALGALANFTAGVTMLAVRARHSPAPPLAGGGDARPGLRPIHALFFLVGFVGLGQEVLWTRYLALVARVTVHTFTLTLATVLCGIVIGSLVSGALADRSIPRARLFGAIQVAFGAGVLALLGTAPETWRGFGSDAGVIFALLLPLAVLSGLSFPLAVRLAEDDPMRAGHGAGVLLAMNTLGGIAGSLVVGFALLPGLGIAASARVLTLVSVATGCAAFLLLERSTSRVLRCAMVGASGGLWLLAPRFADARVPDDFLGSQSELVAVREGLESNIAVLRRLGGLHLEIDRWWQGQDRRNHQVMAAHVPMLLHRAPESVLVVGVGVGQTASRFLMYGPERVDCVDVEPALFDVVREHFGAAWMDDPRVRLIRADGRSHVAHAGGAEDVVSLELGQVFRPGVAAFYTREFYRDVAARLADGGIVAQFVPLPFLGPDTLRSVVRTFLDVFPESVLWYNTAELLILGRPAGRLAFDEERLALLAQDAAIRTDTDFSLWGGPAYRLNRRPVFLAGFLMGPAGLAALAEGAEALTDDRPVLAYATRSAEESRANELALAPLIEAHLEPVDGVLAFELPEEERSAARDVRAKNLADLGAAAVLRRVQGAGSARLPIVVEALARNPESVVANRWRADALVLSGRVAEALTAYEATLAIDPDDFLARHGFAVALHRAGRVADALPHYARAAELRSDDAEVHNNYGAALAASGRRDEALVHFETALRLRPDLPGARENVMRLGGAATVTAPE